MGPVDRNRQIDRILPLIVTELSLNCVSIVVKSSRKAGMFGLVGRIYMRRMLIRLTAGAGPAGLTMVASLV